MVDLRQHLNKETARALDGTRPPQSSALFHAQTAYLWTFWTQSARRIFVSTGKGATRYVCGMAKRRSVHARAYTRALTHRRALSGASAHGGHVLLTYALNLGAEVILHTPGAT